VQRLVGRRHTRASDVRRITTILSKKLTRRAELFSFCLEAGLSGGQRKLLLFELISQRTASHSNLLLVLDEPFAGVTDDFVPFIVGRLNELREQHNILLVTNDHVGTLKDLADNTIIVSAIDRSTVQVNDLENVNREKAILALSVGDEFVYEVSLADLKFFFDVEIANNGALVGVAAFTVFAFSFFLVSFWDSSPDVAALIIVAASLIAFFCLNPYLLALADWRNFVSEEAEALLHASKSLNKALKTLLTLSLIFIVSVIEWGMVNAVVGGFEDVKFWVAILLDSASLTFPFVFFGLYTKLSFQAVQIFGSMPFLFLIFFSTTFSPGSGVTGLKELRYLFPRFYFWCMIPSVQDDMEGCPASDVTLLYMFLSATLGLVMFLIYQTSKAVIRASSTKKATSKKNLLKDAEFTALQVALFGEGVLLKNSMSGTNHTDIAGTNHTIPGSAKDGEERV
jgi:hypothetical protein